MTMMMRKEGGKIRRKNEWNYGLLMTRCRDKLQCTSSLLLLLLSSFLLFPFITPTLAGINDYESSLFPSETYEQTHVGLYTMEDSPSHSANMTSAVELNLRLKDPSSNSLLSIALVGAEDRTTALGQYVDNRRRLCCEEDIAKEASCKVGQLLLNDSVRVESAALSFSSPFLQIEWKPWKSQVYYLYIINCASSDAIVNGNVTWMNPFGYLPGEDYPLPFFFSCLAVCYGVSLLIWCIASYLYRADLQKLQNVIAGVLTLGLIGAIPSVVQYRYYNEAGHPSFFWVLSSVILNVGKRLISRVLIVLVSSGWSVVRPNLEGRAIKYGLPVLSLFYLLFGVTFDIVQSLRNKLNTYVSSSWDILALPITLLDIVFYSWIMFSILTTMAWLHQRKQDEKLRMYRLFWWVLLLLGGLSVVVTFAQSIFMWEGKRDIWWQSWWFFEAWWQTLYLTILWVIAFIWRPNPNNKRYAYSLQISGNEEEGTQMDEMSTNVASVRGEDEANFDNYNQDETFDENAIVLSSGTLGPAPSTVSEETSEETVTILPPPSSSSSVSSPTFPSSPSDSSEAYVKPNEEE